MRLKVLTTTCAFFALALMIGYPWILGKHPGDPVAAGRYLAKSLIYVALIVAALIGAAVCSMLILRQAREEYRREKEELLRQLLEASLKDHGKGPR